MIHTPCIQGGEEWKRLRFGRPTASEFHRIITAKKLQPAEARHRYSLELLAEEIFGVPMDSGTSAAMIHGTDSEAKAVAAYEFETGIDTEVCGFCLTDDGQVGASPDRFVGEPGSLEVKCPMNPAIHLGYLLSPDSLAAEYWTQVQGQLYVTGRKWTDLISYFAGLDMVRIRIEPDPAFQTALESCLRAFLTEHAARLSIAKERGWLKERKPAAQNTDGFVTMRDVEDILAAQRRREG